MDDPNKPDGYATTKAFEETVPKEEEWWAWRIPVHDGWLPLHPPNEYITTVIIPLPPAFGTGNYDPIGDERHTAAKTSRVM